MARIRKNVWKLKAADKTLEWYERAITAMKAKPIADPTSWRFQGAIHEYVRQGDPLASAGDILPSSAEQKKYWNQCQHGSWFFLSWHRMYLHFFESIVGAEVVKLGGPSDWGLPYWNYSDAKDPNARLLPPAFRSATKADGTANALFVATRTSRLQRRPAVCGRCGRRDREPASRARLPESEFRHRLRRPSNQLHAQRRPRRFRRAGAPWQHAHGRRWLDAAVLHGRAGSRSSGCTTPTSIGSGRSGSTGIPATSIPPPANG